MSGWTLSNSDGRIVVVTDGSDNRKTGDMLQVWILAEGMSPVDLVRSGEDSLICGDCVHAGKFDERACYVNVAQGPNSVWNAYQRGRYPFLPVSRYADVFNGRMVRFGAYGDPAFIPLDVLRWVAWHSDGWTGYTHQWRVRPDLRPYLMASVDSKAEYWDAKWDGWRTFRVQQNGADWTTKNEILCPASDEMGRRTQCADCGLCNGVRYRPADPRKDIAIRAHGVGRKRIEARGLIQIGA